MPTVTRSFIPDQPLSKLITKENVLSFLRTHKLIPEQHWISVSERVPGFYTKIFSILVLIQEGSAVLDFIENDISDGKLPLTAGHFEKFDSCNYQKRFLEKQWEFLAPIWEKGRYLHKILDHNAVLPILEERQVGAGGFGTTFEVLFSGVHQGFSDTTEL